MISNNDFIYTRVKLLYEALSRNGYLLPQEKSRLCNLLYLQQIKDGRCFAFKMIDVRVANWKRIIHTRQATALPKDSILGESGAAIAYGRRDLACVIMVGFARLLRTMEILMVRAKQVIMMPGIAKICLMLPESKGTTRTRVPEQVIIIEYPPVVKFLKGVFRGKGPDELIYMGGQRSFGKT